MGPRAALTVAVVLALAGCGASDNMGSGPQDMNLPASDMGAIHCAVVTVGAIDPATGAVKDDAPARLIASVDAMGARGAQWSLVHAGDAPVTPTQAGDEFHVQYDATQAGTWTFSVRFDSGPCPGAEEKVLKNPLGAKQEYRFRVLPPETTGLPLKDFDVFVTGGENLSQDLPLDYGLSISASLHVAGSAATGEVRLVADDGPDAVAFAGSDGKLTVGVGTGTSYTPLLIPQVQAPGIPRAPHFDPNAKAKGATFDGVTFDISGGVAVNGTIVDGAAAAIADARVVMRAGVLPSGPGKSDAGGAFMLWAEPATYTMTFGAADWPDGSVAGVVVPGGGTSVAVAYTIGRVAVGGVVHDDSGAPVADARVTITSDALANVANVSVGGGAAVPAGGRVVRVLFTGPDGALPPLQLPTASYQVIVEPPGPSLDGLTAFSETVSGPASWTLTLAKPAPLTVTVTGLDGKPVAGARLTAIETVGLGAAVVDTTDASGTHVFTSLGKGAPIDLLVEPPPSAKLAGRRVAVPAGGGSVAVPLVVPGLAITGVVRSPSQAPLAGVVVEALCSSCGSSTPLATSLTDANGTYRIYLPDPGNVIVDGGAGD